MQVVLDGLGKTIPTRWLEMNHEERVWHAQNILNKMVEKLGVGHLFVVDIKNFHRIILCEQEPSRPETGKALLKLETELRGELNFGAELHMETREDKNMRSKRQLPPPVKSKN